MKASLVPVAMNRLQLTEYLSPRAPVDTEQHNLLLTTALFLCVHSLDKRERNILGLFIAPFRVVSMVKP